MCRRQCELHIGRIEMVQTWGPNTLIERMATKKPKHGNPCHETRFFSIWNGTPTCQSLQMFQGYLTLGPPQVSVLMGFPTPFMAIMMILLEGKLGWTRDGIWCFYYPCIWRHASSIKEVWLPDRKERKTFSSESSWWFSKHNGYTAYPSLFVLGTSQRNSLVPLQLVDSLKFKILFRSGEHVCGFHLCACIVLCHE